MYRIVAVVEDKKLAQIGHLISDLCVEIEMKPMRNAELVDGVVKAKSNGTATDVVLAVMNDHTGPTPTKLIRAALAKAGFKSQSGTLLTTLKKQKMVKRAGLGKWEIATNGRR
jgi:hypothetical protein